MLCVLSLFRKRICLIVCLHRHRRPAALRQSQSRTNIRTRHDRGTQKNPHLCAGLGSQRGGAHKAVAEDLSMYVLHHTRTHTKTYRAPPQGLKA